MLMRILFFGKLSAQAYKKSMKRIQEQKDI